MNKLQETLFVLFLGLFALALIALPVMALDLSLFQPQPPQECISPEDREQLAKDNGFVVVDKDEELGAVVWVGQGGLHLLDITREGLSCIVGFFYLEDTSA